MSDPCPPRASCRRQPAAAGASHGRGPPPYSPLRGRDAAHQTSPDTLSRSPSRPIKCTITNPEAADSPWVPFWGALKTGDQPGKVLQMRRQEERGRAKSAVLSTVSLGRCCGAIGVFCARSPQHPAPGAKLPGPELSQTAVRRPWPVSPEVLPGLAPSRGRAAQPLCPPGWVPRDLDQRGQAHRSMPGSTGSGAKAPW